MKRLTDCGKWHDPFFFQLSPTGKLLWIYLCDNCDQAGVISLNFKLISFLIGQPIEEKHIVELGDRLQKFRADTWWLPTFVRFQYGVLSPASRPHASVMALLQKHGLAPVMEVSNSKQPVSKNGLPSQPDTLSIPYPKGTHTHSTVLYPPIQVPSGKEGCGEEGSQEASTQDAMQLIGALFQRQAGSVWTYEEQCGIVTLLRRPDWRAEVDTVAAFHQRAGARFFPQSVSRLLGEWSSVLDRARVHDPTQLSASETIFSQKALDRLEKKIQSIRAARPINGWKKGDPDLVMLSELKEERTKLMQKLNLKA